MLIEHAVSHVVQRTSHVVIGGMRRGWKRNTNKETKSHITLAPNTDLGIWGYLSFESLRL